MHVAATKPQRRVGNALASASEDLDSGDNDEPALLKPTRRAVIAATATMTT
jgi:hypothetical protein